MNPEHHEQNDEVENRERDDDVALHPGAYQDARGVDRSLVRYCLTLSPTERMAENESALALSASVRAAARVGEVVAAAAPEPVPAVPRAHGTR